MSSINKILLLALVGINLLGGGLFLIRSNNFQTNRVIFETYKSNSQTIKVDIKGEVKNPGTYELQDTSRVEEVIASAGGILVTADQDWISQYINMSQIISDGQKIYIPAKNSEKPAEIKIAINASSKATLITLRRIGPVTADKIIAARPYSDINELWEKKIVSQKVFEEIKAHISLW